MILPRVNSKHLSTKSFIYYTYHDAVLNFLIDPGAAWGGGTIRAKDRCTTNLFQKTGDQCNTY